MIVNINDNPEVVAVIVTLGKKTARLKNCIESLYNQVTGLRLGILCIVNNSEFDVNILDTTRVTTIVTGLNLGFAGALTFSRQFIQSHFLWIIQDDMLVDQSCLQELYSGLHNIPTMAAVAPMVVTKEGEVVWGSCGGIVDSLGKIKWLPEKQTPISKLGDLHLLSYIPSRGMLIRLSSWDEVSGVDPRYYPVNWTDIDLCAAFRQQGQKFELVKSAIAWHEGNGSTPAMIGQLAYHRNNKLYISKWINTGSTQNDAQKQVHAKIDRKLLGIVAQNAADAFLELGHEYTTNIQSLQEQNKNLNLMHEQYKQNLPSEIQSITARFHQLEGELKGVYNSISWKLTQPLRSLKAALLKYNRYRRHR